MVLGDVSKMSVFRLALEKSKCLQSVNVFNSFNLLSFMGTKHAYLGSSAAEPRGGSQRDALTDAQLFVSLSEAIPHQRQVFPLRHRVFAEADVSHQP